MMEDSGANRGAAAGVADRGRAGEIAGVAGEMIDLMGRHVIPKIDTDPVHRTTRMRESAA